MNNKTLSHNACYAHPAVSVPLEFDTPQNRISIRIYAYSDVTNVDIFLYEYHGLYWYSFCPALGKIMNSCGFVGLKNCVASLRDTVRGLGFILDNSDSLTRFVRAWNRQGKKVA